MPHGIPAVSQDDAGRLHAYFHVRRPVGGIRRERRARSARGYKVAAASVAADSACVSKRAHVRARTGHPAVLARSVCGPQHRPCECASSTLPCP